MRAQIIKINNQNITVVAKNKHYICEIKGSLKKDKKIIFMVGDYVSVALGKSQYDVNYINQLLPRSNQLKRPKISNVNKVVYITTLKQPPFNNYQLSTYLLSACFNKINLMFCFNKTDLLNKKDRVHLHHLLKTYRSLGYVCVAMTNVKHHCFNILKLRSKLGRKLCVLAGRTGVGKSTIINGLFKDVHAKVQTVSQGNQKGRHTTTVNQIYTNHYLKIADTPGFLSFDLNNLQATELAHCFSTVLQAKAVCKFKNCLHLKEKNCKIKLILKSNRLYNDFYQDYQKMQQEIKNNKKHG